MNENNTDIQSDDEIAVGHDGRPRVVLSDVTISFPPEQVPEQVPNEITSKPEEAANSFQLQRRSRQPRACRGVLAGDSDTAAPNVTILQGGSSVPASSDAQAAAAGRPALRSSARLHADAHAAQTSETSGSAISDGQTGICTRRQAKLNKQSSQHNRQHIQPSQGDFSSDDDLAVVGRSQRQGRVLNHAAANQSATNEGPSCNQSMGNEAQTGVAEKPFAVRRNRPRLQLNRKAKGDMSAASQAASAPGTSASSTSQQQ